MSNPAQLDAAISEWEAERKEHELVKQMLEETARQLDGANNRIALLTEQIAHERGEKERAQRRTVTLEAQLATIATTTYDVGLMLSRIVGTTVGKIMDRAEDGAAAAGRVEPALPPASEPDDIPLFLRTADALPGARL